MLNANSLVVCMEKYIISAVLYSHLYICILTFSVKDSKLSSIASKIGLVTATFGGYSLSVLSKAKAYSFLSHSVLSFSLNIFYLLLFIIPLLFSPEILLAGHSVLFLDHPTAVLIKCLKYVLNYCGSTQLRMSWVNTG